MADKCRHWIDEEDSLHPVLFHHVHLVTDAHVAEVRHTGNRAFEDFLARMQAQARGKSRGVFGIDRHVDCSHSRYLQQGS